ncbi:polyamine aminopropyltransferase [Turneriella parva]|uniref:Polyamine aminopropyltransferase n=1 Tax=Turneriella parva (strain ATCC BAA-1111 / DSM 21527 / NCTC 11395 / H) TaxID=869212 RepID=I4B0W2_TURPD|nr:polyamine aminopropyltransferase [Turneriella parva]AFM10919.1 Spermidine synthase [Turneriella parva DSM 21527]
MRSAKIQSSLLLFSAFLIAACGLVYELIAGTVSSYLLGDSVTQFSRTIGVYLFAMGVGSYLSRFILRNAIEKFIDLEIALALVGGFAAPLLFIVFSFTAHYAFVLYALLIVIGTLVGLEIPLLLRILKDRMNFRDLVARVLSLDYIGGLVAAVSFPILLLRPEVGLIRASILAGILNVLVAFVALYVFQAQVRLRLLLVKACAVLLVLVVALVYSKPIQGFLDQELHNDPVVYSEQSHYQKIVITSWHEYFSLFLNNNLQFNSFDEYRYHEALVHVPVQMVLDRRGPKAPLRVLIMGGGDGLAIREFLRYPNVVGVDLVDIDPAMTKLAREHPWLRDLNRDALADKRVNVFHEDAFIYIEKPKSQYDVVILDFPDPGNFAIGKLYSDMFFHRLKRVLAPGAVAVTQSTSPFVARTAFWCIHNTVESQGYKTLPYHAYVPSFGEWGFVAFSREPLAMPQKLLLENEMRFLTREVLQSMAFFPADMARVATEVQTLMTQNLVHYYEREWHRATR